MTDCAYEQNGQWDVRELQSECRGLRTDLDNLLQENTLLRQEVVDLRKCFTALRNRLDATEMAEVGR